MTDNASSDLDLDALAALAEAATPVETWHVGTADMERANNFHRAANPRTVLALIARIREEEKRLTPPHPYHLVREGQAVIDGKVVELQDYVDDVNTFGGPPR